MHILCGEVFFAKFLVTLSTLLSASLNVDCRADLYSTKPVSLAQTVQKLLLQLLFYHNNGAV
jgi:hypothetical protein